MSLFESLLCFGVILSSFFSPLTEAKALDDYILHYEELSYNTDHLHDAHIRHRRSLDPHVHIDLHAFNKPMTLKLQHNREEFDPDFTLEFNGTTTKPDLSFLYKGQVIGKPGSRVTGSIIEGVFQGSIIFPEENEIYHVEKSNRFENRPASHSVIYREFDMNLDPYRERRQRERREARELGTCGNANAKQWMRTVVDSEVIPSNRAKRHEKLWQEIYSSDEGASLKYSAKANEESKQRVRRATGDSSLYSVNDKKDSCYMSLMSDPFLFEHYKAKAGNNDIVARDEILAFFQSHVAAINGIYTTTVFQTYDGTTKYTGVKFTIQKTKVMTQGDCNDVTYSRFCEPNVDVSNFLNMNSLLNHDLFCLAYVFTYRDFSQGTLGLAWVGSASSASGGVCERNKRFTEGSSQVSKSLNTGVCTLINYGKEVPSKVSQLTFAHEVGHNFGSPHDSGAQCAPYGTNMPTASDGNYIMFASATMGDKPHNNQFSVCSKDNITRVLQAVLTSSSKYNCFKESGPFCGNGVVEPNEECDCGFAEDCQDDCCHGRSDPNDALNLSCKLKPQAACSPTAGPCCSINCQFAGSTQICRYATDCAKRAMCAGNNASCPPSDREDDGKLCSNAGFTCQQGECSGSLCNAIAPVNTWSECFTIGATKTKEEQEQLCKVACQKPNTNDTANCIVSNSIPSTEAAYEGMIDAVLAARGESTSDDGVKLAPGSPCNNFQGYCDVFYRCRGVDAEGPLARLKNLIFNPETLQDISNWIVEYWWAVLLMAIGLVVAMALFIKFCAVHTPSSNPKAKPARKLSETMTLRRKRHQNQNRPLPQQPPVQPLYDPRGRQSKERGQYYDSRNPLGPPPPYPGSSTSASGSHLGPPHGHGKKGKARKGQQLEMGRV